MTATIVPEILFDQLDSRTRDLLELRRSKKGMRRRGWVVRRVLASSDLAGLLAAFVFAELVYSTHARRPGSVGWWSEFALFALSLPIWLVTTKLYGLYDRDGARTDHSTADEFAAVFHLITVCTWSLYATCRLTTWFDPPFGKLFLFWLFAIASVLVSRCLARVYVRRRISYLQNTVIVGAGTIGQVIAKGFLRHPEYGLNLVGFIDSDPRELDPALRHVAILGSPEDLSTVVKLLDVERVVIAFSYASHDETIRNVRMLYQLGVQVDVVPRLFEVVGPSVGLHAVEGLPLMGLAPPRLSRSSLAVKRAADVLGSLIGLVLLAPVFLAVALLIKVDSDGPVFYRHGRVGRKRKAIDVLKFRTMYLTYCRGTSYGGADAEAEFERLMEDPKFKSEFEATFKLELDPRVTRIGRFLRRSSLDELPQLINVLRGDLSLVGPRPVTTEELPRYGDWADLVLNARPGVTGLWQINGRSSIDYDDRVRLDLAYITGWRFNLDVAIIARTFRTLITGRGAY